MGEIEETKKRCIQRVQSSLTIKSDYLANITSPLYGLSPGFGMSWAQSFHFSKIGLEEDIDPWDDEVFKKVDDSHLSGVDFLDGAGEKILNNGKGSLPEMSHLFGKGGDVIEECWSEESAVYNWLDGESELAVDEWDGAGRNFVF